MAPTDDERREVARRLRGIKDTREGCGHDMCCDLWSAIFDSDYRCTELCDECETAVLDRLADLIDPGESGQNLDKNQDSVQIESPAVQMACECDREALLELADILGSTRETDCSGCRLEGAGCAECSSGVAREAARRIREALGVEP